MTATVGRRNRPELVEGILEGLRWLGLQWDEEPSFQSGRLPGYHAAAQKLLASGAAYLCYCPPEKYAGGDAAEEGAEAKTQRRVTRCSCRDGASTLRSTIRKARRYDAYACNVPGAYQFEDAVFGKREVSNDEIEDFVLMRSAKGGGAADSTLPTYQLGALPSSDDVDMRITHVIQKAPITSRTRQSRCCCTAALGAPLPIFAHLPLILGADRTRLSQAPRRGQRQPLPRGGFSCPKLSGISWRCWAGRPGRIRRMMRTPI